MNRSIIVKLSVILLVSVLVHSVFWFFKTGQLTKHVNNFISENSANISASEVSVSGFPFNQKLTIKDLKFTIPNPALNKYHVIAKEIQASASIFSNDFVVELLDKVMVQDSENNSGSVEFTQQPQIAFAVRDGLIAHFSYQDVGHRALDADKNVIYSAAATSVNIDSVIDNNEQITAHLLVNVRDIENFTLLDAYKNSSEKRIIDGIKTGEVTIGATNNPVAADAVVIDANAKVQAVAATSLDAVANVKNEVNAAAAKLPAAAASASAINNANIAASTQQAAAAANPSLASQVALTLDPNNNTALPTAAIPDQALAMIVNADILKTSLALDFEYVLTPSRNEQQASVPLDPTQMQESIQYNKSLKINNLELANSLYKIVANGQINSFQDDNMPSGFVTIRIDNASNFVDYVVNGFNQMAAQKKPANNDVQAADLAAQSSAPQDAYQNFLKKVAAGLPAISRELASKNQLSKDNSAVYDIRREKNLEFVINETPLREIVGKF